MRELGVVEYEFKDANSSYKIVLDPKPSGGSIPSHQGLGEGEEAKDPREAPLPEAYRKLPAAYRNVNLYGGRLPKLDG